MLRQPAADESAFDWHCVYAAGSNRALDVGHSLGRICSVRSGASQIGLAGAVKACIQRRSGSMSRSLTVPADINSTKV